MRANKGSALKKTSGSDKKHQQHVPVPINTVVQPIPSRPLHSILLTPSNSQPGTPGIMSRRPSDSSPSRPTITGKCVHFPCAPEKLNNYSYTHSREHYDRSPILPTAAVLDIPSCRNNENEGSWIQCLQRKVSEAAEQDVPSSPTAEKVAAAAAVSSSDAPVLTSDSSSSSESEDLVTPLSASPPFQNAGLASPSEKRGFNSFFPATSGSSAGSLPLSAEPDDAMHCDNELDHWKQSTTSFMVDDGTEDHEDEDEEAESDEESAPVRKPGMCSLGKFSRSDLFECDAFGGCEHSLLCIMIQLVHLTDCNLVSSLERAHLFIFIHPHILSHVYSPPVAFSSKEHS